MVDQIERLRTLLKILEKRDPNTPGLSDRIISVKERIAKLTNVENLIRNPMPGPLPDPPKKKKKIVQKVVEEEVDE